MGGSASLVQIPNDLLNESKASRTLGRQNSRLAQVQLSTEVLANLRRKSGSGMRKPEVTPRYDVPVHVLNLLEKVGIKQHPDGPAGPTSNTKKLVIHIFECLEGLQHLVKAEQDIPQDDTSDHISDSHSVVEANKESVGRLLHEMITIYTLCGDTLRVLLNTNPDAARVEDNFGRLPIHVAVDRDQPWCEAIERLIVAFPEGLNLRDSGGRLPLHIAVDRQEPNMEVVKMLLERNPHAAMARRGVGRLPLHYAIFADTPSMEVIEALLAAAPEGAQTTDVYGRLPLHYAVDKAKPDLAVVEALLAAFPAGASIRDTHQKLPLTVAVERERIDLRVVQRLYEAYPQALEERGAGHKTPLQVLVECNPTSLFVVDFLARQFRAAICETSHPLKRDSPMLLALDRKLHHISRRFLTLCPDYDPALLRNMNWKARKIAFLLAKGQIFRPSVLRRLAQMAMGGSPKCVEPVSPAEGMRYQNLLVSSAARTTLASNKVFMSELNAQILPRRRGNSNTGLPPLMSPHRSPGGADYKSIRYPRDPSRGSPTLQLQVPMSGHDSGMDIPSSYWEECTDVHSIYDNQPSVAPSPRGHKVNFYLKLYKTNSDAFRLAVTFL